MVSRRSIFNLRLKTQVILFLFLLIIISVALLYRAISSEDVPTKPSSLFPSMKKRPIRFQPKYIPNFNKMEPDDLSLVSNDDPSWDNVEDSSFLVKNNELMSVKDRDLLSANSREALTNFLLTLYPTNWKLAPETDVVAFDLKYLLLDYNFESEMSCKEIDSLRKGSQISFSSTKYIEYGYEDGQGQTNDYNSYYDGYRQSHNSHSRRGSSDLAIKSPSNDQDTKIACMKQIYDPELCATMGNYRFLREVLFLNVLRHRSIPSVKGYCLRGNAISLRLQSKGLILVTEVGTPITESYIRVSSWTRKLSMALQISRLLVFLESSPLGSLRFSRLQMKDFIVVKESKVMLADFDDLEVGEKSCFRDSDCVHQDSGKGVVCASGVCAGLNALSNLDLTAKVILLPMLYPPVGKDAAELVEKLQRTDITPIKLVSVLNSLHSQAPPDRPNPPSRRQNSDFIVRHNQDSPVVDNMAVKVREGGDSEPVRPKEPPSLIIDDILTRFLRHNGKNFAGLYDYSCAGSRVTWGCVFTVTSLKQAATLCYKDDACKSFVVFTTLPESETLMTIVLKNATDDRPTSSSGTTLFIKIEPAPGDVPAPPMGAQGPVDVAENRIHRDRGDENTGGGGEDDVVDGEDEDDDDDDDDDADDAAANASAEIRECLDRMLQTYKSARYSREKRLMAHLGLKGIREQSWRISAFNQDLGDFSHIHRVEGGGGRLLTELVKRNNKMAAAEDKDEVATKATFMAEDGPQAYHVAYAWVYHMDRILGFYHTPPCVGKALTASDVDTLHTSFSWEETFRPLIQADGTLSGILTAPQPRVMNLSKLTVTPLSAMTQEVVPFDRPQKLQLEYALLWWMAGMNKADNEHLGYKGHLIHFHADKAFVNTVSTYYLNHCQFSNVAYKALMCFRCKSDAVSTSICHFAEEASNRVQAMFEDEVELDFHEQSASKLMSTINQVASTIVYKVDSCIKKFGREKVLY